MRKFEYYPHMIKFFSASAIWSIANYLPIFAKSLGISDMDIGVLATLYATAMFISTYAFGRLADIIGRRKLIIFGLLLSSISFLLYAYAKDFDTLLSIRILSGIGISMQASAVVAYAHDAGHKLGKLTSFESLGVAVGSILVGIIALYFDIISIFLISAAFFLFAFLVSLRLEKVNYKKINGQMPVFPHHILKKNLPVYISFFIRHAAANSIWVFWGLYLLQLGADLFLIGLAMAVNTFTQFLVMFFVADKINVKKLVSVGTLLTAVTFFIFGISTSFWQILGAQLILGISWGFLYIGSIRWVTDDSKEKATSIGLLNSFINLAQLTGPLIATLVIGFGGYRMIMYAGAAMAFCSFIAFDILAKSR